ncbi:MAG TPA: hypothetical protein VL328_00510 [Gemmatimonadaceae bacterium]|jgi:hypothetical protein|nr:hypothetical protein [Gemmatimonadaceae bacterium]
MPAARARLLVAAAGLAVVGAASCGPPRRPEIRQGSKSYLFTITSDPIPPHAREDVVYTVTVRDRKSGQPIETGEGRIFANTIDGARTYDGFVKAPAVGAYSGKLRFVVAGQWAIGIQFHSDSTKPLEKTEWMQDVLQERPGTP